MTVEVPGGEHVLLLRFEDTPVRVAGTLITLLTGFLVVAAWGWEVKGKGIRESGNQAIRQSGNQ